MLTIRYRETDRTADVEMRHDKTLGLVLVGKGNAFYLDGELEDDKAEWTVAADDFADEWELVRASDEDCARLRRAGYRV
jgi:hypothetical protein